MQCHDGGHPATWWHDAAKVVHEVNLLRAQMPWQPGILDEYAAQYVAAFRYRGHHRVRGRSQLRVGLDEARQAERNHVDIVTFGQWVEQAGRVALAPAHDSRHEPQEIEPDAEGHEQAAL